MSSFKITGNRFFIRSGFAILETDGQLSVIESQKNQVEMPESLIIDGEINSEILKMMGKNEDWLKKEITSTWS